MSYQPLHQKYRPQTFASLVGQEAITITLNNAIANLKIAPAYFFTGPRGTGKTSSARILAKSLNCINTQKPTTTPCGECRICQGIIKGNCLDVIEIDAASYTGVDNIREVIEGSRVGCAECRYKVYVIDECHMLSSAAFNALLKTLEEPPKNVVFILATTDPQRVLPTIISRCQRFDFRRIPLEAMVKHLKFICSEEKIHIANEALTVIAQIANGGLRDAQSLLDQLSLFSGEITPERVWDLVGTVSEGDLLDLLKAIQKANAEQALEKTRAILNRGKEPLTLLQNLANFYVNLLLAKTAPNRSDLVQLTDQSWEELKQLGRIWDISWIIQGQQHLKNTEVQLKNSTQPRLWLEIAILSLLPQVGGDASEILDCISQDSLIQTAIPLKQTMVSSILSPATTAAPAPLAEIPQPASTAQQRLITKIYTDGSCIGNPGPGGWAFVAYYNDNTTEERADGPIPDTTNNRMEIQAVIAALEFYNNSQQKEPIIIYTDSEYVKNGVTKWMKGWKQKQWKKADGDLVVNVDLWEHLDGLNSTQVTWEHVKGHSGDPGNERTDYLAKSYAQKQQPQTSSSEKQSQTPQASETKSLEKENLWEQVLNLVRPTSTQNLLRQHCSLLAFDNNYAVIGVKSNPLLKMVSQRIANLESAFQQLYQQRINISLQVGNAVDKKNQVNTLNPTELTKELEKEKIAPKVEKYNELPQNNDQINVPEPDSALSELKESSKTFNGDLHQVAQSWAKFFKGEIIV